MQWTTCVVNPIVNAPVFVNINSRIYISKGCFRAELLLTQDQVLATSGLYCDICRDVTELNMSQPYSNQLSVDCLAIVGIAGLNLNGIVGSHLCRIK